MWGPITKNVNRRAIGMMEIRVGASLPYISIATPVLSQANSLGALGKTALNGEKEFHEFKSGFPEAIDGIVPLSEKMQIEVEFKEITPKNLAMSSGINPFGDVDSTVTVLGQKTTGGTITGDITVDNEGGVLDEMYIVSFTGATAGKIFGATTGYVHTFSAVDAAMEPVDGNAKALFTIPANFFSGTWAADDHFTFRTTRFVAGTSVYASDYEGSIALGMSKAPEYVRVEAIMTFPNETNKMITILPRAQAQSSVAIDAGNDDVSIPVTFNAAPATSNIVGGHSVWNTMPLGVIRLV